MLAYSAYSSELKVCAPGVSDACLIGVNGDGYLGVVPHAGGVGQSPMWMSAPGPVARHHPSKPTTKAHGRLSESKISRPAQASFGNPR